MFVQSIFSGESGVDTGDIPASLRHRRSASCYSQRTPPGAGNRLIWTYSVWFQRGSLGTQQWLLDAGSDGNNESAIVLEANDTLQIYNYVAASYGKWLITNAVLRDPSSFYHLVVSSNGTTWFKMYLNGVELISFSTNTGTNGTNWFFNSSSYFMRAGARFNGTGHFDGQIARECFVADSALAASDFGYFNTETNEWVTKTAAQVKAVVDAGGANSSMRDFDDPNFATYNVGKDYSSKGNHWTPNNFSLTAGTSYDWMLDVPGNSFATLNPIDRLGATSNFDVISDGNLKVATNSAATLGSVGSMYMPSGSWYWEVTPNTWTSSLARVGVATPAAAQYCAYYSRTGEKSINGSLTAYGATYTLGDVIGVGYDATAGTVTFYKNGVSQGMISGIPSGAAPWVSDESGGGSVTLDLNFGQAPLHASATYHSAAGGYFRYAPPSGYKALCQRNMPDPAILNPEKHFDVDTYTGTGSAINRTGFSLQPDFVWIKGRASAYTHALFDSVRGITKVLNSNTTDAEATEAGGAGLTALNSDGYSLGTNAADASTNVNTQTFAAWLWKAGGAVVTNNAGSISSQVSANVEAGVSIVTYTGNLSSAGTATVGHGLGKAPGLIISKSRNNAGGDTGQWVARHKYLASANHYLRLNTTDTSVDSSADGSMSASTSTVFSTNWTSGMNSNGGNFVALCFAEIPGFSKIFSYTGNGNVDGPFVHCGFKPKFVLVKRTDVIGSWFILDAIRNTVNVCNLELYPNVADAEGTNTAADFTANGFKLRGTDAWKNASGGTYIGIAFADVPAKYSLAR